MNGSPSPAPAPLTRPGRLRPGSPVAVVSPSGPCHPGLVAEGSQILTGWGLDVRVGPHALARHSSLSYLAGTDEDRAADLEQAWLDPEIEAVLCSRGGYGAQRMVDRLDWAAMAAVPPKIFAGFSDVTALHEAFALRLGLATLHSPTIGGDGFIQHPEAQQALRQALFTPDVPAGRTLHSDGTPWLVPGRATGRTAGGNLSMLVTNLATPDGRDSASQRFRGSAPATPGQAPPPEPARFRGSAPATPAQAPPPEPARFRGSAPAPTSHHQSSGFAGCILLLEDVNEECYRLDRMLTQLLRSGALDGVAGVALGTWTGCLPADGVRPVLADRLAGLGVPVAWGFGFGHMAPQPVIPLGVPAELDSATGTLTFLEPAVS